MKKIAIAAMALCISTMAFAENSLHYNMLEFQESVSINVPNDTMHITLNMETQHKNRHTASQLTTQKLNQVTEKLKKIKNSRWNWAIAACIHNTMISKKISSVGATA